MSRSARSKESEAQPMTAKPLYINGRHVASETTHAVNNPWDGALLADVCVADGAQVEEAVATAHAAFQTTRKMTADARAVILENIALLIAERRLHRGPLRGGGSIEGS